MGRWVPAVVAAGMAIGAWAWAQGTGPGATQVAARTAGSLNQEQKVEQALNRLTWGPQPGDMAAVEKIGLYKWMDAQLHPERIAENPILNEALAGLDSLRMTPAQLIQSYPPGQAIRQMMQGARPLPSDPKLRAVVETEIEVLRQREQIKASASDAAVPGGRGPAAALGAEPLVMGAPALDALLSADQVASLTTGPIRDRVATLESLPTPQRDQVLLSLPRKDANQLSPWIPIGQQHRIDYYLRPQQVTQLDLLGAKVLRAVYSNRQLEDVLTDFWFNHFNIWIQKGQDRDLIASYERDAIRPHVLGKFHDLLLATAESPAMMFYLDNWQSVDPKVNKRGLNENYGREIMELHTLGVNGGYTQKDVTEVARCFTGWTIFQPLRQAQFVYNDRLHDHGEKVVLGRTIKSGGGMSDGLEVLDMLARSPATAHHISLELAQRFVADNPPDALVDRMTRKFLSSDGDLRQVMETMISSPEFFDPQYFDNKVKSPLEVVASSVRALGADVSNPTRLTQIVASMGQPLYGKEPPTGYANTGDQWVSSSGLIARMNFALQIAANQIPGVQVDLSPFAGGEARPLAVEQTLFADLLGRPAAPATQATIARVIAPMAVDTVAPEAASPQPATPAQVQRMTGLVLGSPDFQKH